MRGTQRILTNQLYFQMHSGLSVDCDENCNFADPVFTDSDTSQTRSQNIHNESLICHFIDVLFQALTLRKKPSTKESIISESRKLAHEYFASKFGPYDSELKVQMLNQFSVHETRVHMDVLHTLQNACLYLENNHPNIYVDLAKNFNVHKTELTRNNRNLTEVFNIVTDHMFRDGITWGKIVAMYALSGSLAMDCIRRNDREYVLALCDMLTCYVRTNLVSWMYSKGGWVGILEDFKSKEPSQRLSPYTIASVFVLIVVLFLIFIVVIMFGRT